MQQKNAFFVWSDLAARHSLTQYILFPYFSLFQLHNNISNQQQQRRASKSNLSASSIFPEEKVKKKKKYMRRDNLRDFNSEKMEGDPCYIV